MTNPKDKNQQKMLEVIELLSLSREELALAEAYLSGEKNEEVLAQFPFRDISGVLPNPFWQVFEELKSRERTEEVRHLFELLFAIGQSTCHALVPPDIIKDTLKSFQFECDAAKKTAVFGAMIACEHGQFHFSGYAIDRLMKIAGLSSQRAEKLKEAYTYQKNADNNGKLILLCAYFIAKYQKALEETQEKEKALEPPEDGKDWNGVEQVFDIAVESEDIPLLQEYEDIVLSGLGAVFQNQLNPATLQNIMGEISKDQLTDETLQQVSSVSADLFLLKLYGGAAYLGFPFSAKLKNTVKVCLAARTNIQPNPDFVGEDMLNAIKDISESLVLDIRRRGGLFSIIFGIDTENYIHWAAVRECKPLLRKMLRYYRNSYLKVMDKSQLDTSALMLKIVQNQETQLFYELEKKKKEGWMQRDKEKLIALLIGNDYKSSELVRAYLQGEEVIRSLYPYADLSQKNQGAYSGAWIGDLLDKYCSQYQDTVFLRKAQTYMLIKQFYAFWGVYNMIREEQGICDLFQGFAEENAAVVYQLVGVERICDYHAYNETMRDMVVEKTAEIFAEYLKQNREETLEAFSKASAFGRYFGLHVLRKEAQENKKEILAYSQDTAKVVKEELLDILYGQPDWENEMKNLLSSKKAGERELAVKVLGHWQKEDRRYNELFAQTLEIEKNNKVRVLLECLLEIESKDVSDSGMISREELVKELHKGNKKRALTWAYETPFSAVHQKSGEEVSEEYLQAILLCYASVDGCGISKKAAVLAENLQTEELAVYINELYDKWLESGAEAKKKWVLYAAAIHGGAEIVQKMHHKIQEWPKASRGAIASEAVRALTLSPLPQALLIVDGIARKFKFKQIKSAAQSALEFAAAQLGISREELADRIVPNLGFDEKMERHFDYGARSFRVTITPALEIEVFDDTGKKLKNMPSPGKKDDETKAAAAYEEFKQMKKQMKLTVTSQKQRLEIALSTAREWTVEAWEALFVKNPIMHQFAIGLLWGVYQDRKLVQTFRYMEDGTFNTEDEEEYQLPKQGQIGLVHPIELSQELKDAWRQQLEDYEIVQPIDQLERNIYCVTEEEAKSKQLLRFGGYLINDLSLCGKLLDIGWYRGSTQDGGGFYTFYREDPEVGFGVELHFSGTYVGCINDEVTIYDARFYKPDTIPHGSYTYDEVEEEQAFFLGEVPKRYFSEIIWQLTKATASSQDQDENWKKGADIWKTTPKHE